jgi:hypothetical protein
MYPLFAADAAIFTCVAGESLLPNEYESTATPTTTGQAQLLATPTTLKEQSARKKQKLGQNLPP